jgi:hypothetical protein
LAEGRRIMKPLVVHAFFGGQPCNSRLATTDADLARHGPFDKKPVRFPKRHHP